MIIDMIGSEEKDIQFQVVTETPSSPEAKFLTDDNTVIKKNFSIEPGNGEKFISHEDASRSAVLLFNAKDAETTQYKGFAGNLTPTGAGVSILLHGLLDHGYQWFKKGHDPSRNEGVDFQNRSIIRMGAPALIRNGADHADD